MTATMTTGGAVMMSAVGCGLHVGASVMATMTMADDELAISILDALSWHCDNDDSELSDYDPINGCYAPKAGKCQDEWIKTMQERGRGDEITLSALAQTICCCRCHV